MTHFYWVENYRLVADPLQVGPSLWKVRFCCKLHVHIKKIRTFATILEVIVTVSLFRCFYLPGFKIFLSFHWNLRTLQGAVNPRVCGPSLCWPNYVVLQLSLHTRSPVCFNSRFYFFIYPVCHLLRTHLSCLLLLFHYGILQVCVSVAENKCVPNDCTYQLLLMSQETESLSAGRSLRQHLKLCSSRDFYPRNFFLFLILTFSDKCISHFTASPIVVSVMFLVRELKLGSSSVFHGKSEQEWCWISV